MENIEMNNINLEDTNGVVEAAMEASEEIKNSGSGIGWFVATVVGLGVAGVAFALHKTKDKRAIKRDARDIERLRARGYEVYIPEEPEDSEVYEEDVNEIE